MVPKFQLAGGIVLVCVLLSTPCVGILGDGQKELLYGDLVVRGVIGQIDTAYARERDYFVDSGRPNGPVAVTFVRIDIHEILRGPEGMVTVTAVAPGAFPPGIPNESGAIFSIYGHSFHFQEGDEVIYCLWHDELNPGVFLVPPNEGRFVRDEKGRWINQATRVSYSIETVREVVSRGRVEHLVVESDLVIGGEVLSVWNSTREGYRDTQTQRITMSVGDSFKGNVEGSTVSFSFTKIGGPDVVPTPDVVEGETWVVFLKRIDGELRPFAGLNGMLKIDGSQVLRNSVLCEFSRGQLVQKLSQEVDR